MPTKVVTEVTIKVSLIRYSRFSPQDAQFADVNFNMLRDFWIAGAIGAALAFVCRKLLRLTSHSNA